MWHFLEKSQKLWGIKAVDRSSRRTIAWVTGDCDAATFQRLYDKLKPLPNSHPIPEIFSQYQDSLIALLGESPHLFVIRIFKKFESVD